MSFGVIGLLIGSLKKFSDFENKIDWKTAEKAGCNHLLAPLEVLCPALGPLTQERLGPA